MLTPSEQVWAPAASAPVNVDAQFAGAREQRGDQDAQREVPAEGLLAQFRGIEGDGGRLEQRARVIDEAQLSSAAGSASFSCPGHRPRCMSSRIDGCMRATVRGSLASPCSLATSATRRPSSASRQAAARPAGPAPATITSNSLMARNWTCRATGFQGPSCRSHLAASAVFTMLSRPEKASCQCAKLRAAVAPAEGPAGGNRCRRA